MLFMDSSFVLFPTCCRACLPGVAPVAGRVTFRDVRLCTSSGKISSKCFNNNVSEQSGLFITCGL